jgi:hypothetical protein
MTLPVSYAEMDVIIQREIDITKSFLGQVNNGIITLDNNGNTQRTPKINIKANGNITSLTITNTTLNCSIQINQSFVNGDVIVIDDYLTYKNGVEIDAIFNAPFWLKENSNNTIQLTIIGGSTIDIGFTWKQASPDQLVQLFVQRFSPTKNKTYQRKAGSVINPYNNGSKFKGADYQYSLEKFWYNGDFFDDEEESSYRIIYKTDNDLADIGTPRKTYCLCGCVIENHQISHQDNQVIGETISGSADKRFEMTYQG